MTSPVLFSSKSDDWSTPVNLYAELDKEFHFDFDPCPLGGTTGLEDDWGAHVFCNPPYSNIKGFLEKAKCELSKGSKVIVFLVPSRTDTRWFHDHVYNQAEIRFIKGRLKFGNSKNSAPFPSMIAIFRRNN